jgi:RimJ/RimL family protein N-acetyltransferase
MGAQILTGIKMKTDELDLSLSAIDEERFGIRTARVKNLSLSTLSEVMDFCRSEEVVLLIARSPVSDLRAAQDMEKKGFLLMDTLVYWERKLDPSSIPECQEKIAIRPLRSGEVEDVKKVAQKSFQGYFGHYHADDRLDPKKCDEAYVSWAVRSCMSRDVADEVLVAAENDSVIGYFTLRLNSPDEGEAVIGGVAPTAQGKGIYRSFIVQGMKWFLSKGASRMVVSTQITNTAVQKVWARLGFEPKRSFYTFHKWFDRP